jgi:pyruvate dehydrogenase E1 component alpha subunit
MGRRVGLSTGGIGPGILGVPGPQKDGDMTATLENEDRRRLFRDILRIRRVEERIIELYPEQEIRCPTHLSIGQEAVAAGVCAHLRGEDYVVSAHRSHAHYLSKGGDLGAMLAELYGKATGCARGKGGSMHLIDRSVGFIGCVPIVGSTISIGVGAAFGSVLRGEEDLTVIFFGDAAAETGSFHESLNFGALQRLPVVFVCENNLYSVNTPMSARQPDSRRIIDVARGHGLDVVQADGQEVEQVYAIAGEKIERVRRGSGPVFMEFMTYRWMEHCGPLRDTHLGFRPPGEYESWTERCPIKLHRETLRSEGVMSEADFELVDREVEAEIDRAVEFAKASPFPERARLLEDVFAE